MSPQHHRPSTQEDPWDWLEQQQTEYAQQADQITAALQQQWDTAESAQRERQKHETRQFQHARHQLESDTPDTVSNAHHTPRQPVQPRHHSERI